MLHTDGGQVSPKNKSQRGIKMATNVKDVANRKTGVMFVLPVKLKALLDKTADTEKTSVSTIVRKAVAQYLNYELSPSDVGRVTKYASVEERIAAQKAREKDRRDVIKQLLAMYKSGKISLDEGLPEDVDDLSDEEEDEETTA